MLKRSVVVCALVAAGGGDAAAQSSRIEITGEAERSSRRGPAETFTGVAMIEMLFGAHEGSRATGARVTFEPGARSAWHTHPAGQVLIVTAGRGWVQEWDGSKREIAVGDVVWTPPGVKHWHGATSSSSMTHLALQEVVDGSAVNWMEHVTDAQYTQPAASRGGPQASATGLPDPRRSQEPGQ